MNKESHDINHDHEPEPIAESSTTQAEEAGKPPYLIEEARSARARCKTCRKKIAKQTLRLGILIEGPFGPGYLWHHLKCAAGRLPERVQEAYEQEAWRGATPIPKVPSLESLMKLKAQAEERRATRKFPPYAERAPSGRSSCKHCGQTIEKGTWRIVLGREVEFGSQVRTTPINVLPAHVKEVLQEPDCTSAPGDLAATIEKNSGLTTADFTAVLTAIGSLD